jgi:hypothetical protein
LPADRHAWLGASEGPIARPRESAPGAVKGLSCGLAALLSGTRTTRPWPSKPSEKSSLKRAVSGRWTRRVSRSCRRFNIPVRTRQIQVDHYPSLMRNTSNLATFAEADISHFGILSAFWLTARRPDLLEMANIRRGWGFRSDGQIIAHPSPRPAFLPTPERHSPSLRRAVRFWLTAQFARCCMEAAVRGFREPHQLAASESQPDERCDLSGGGAQNSRAHVGNDSVSS